MSEVFEDDDTAHWHDLFGRGFEALDQGRASQARAFFEQADRLVVSWENQLYLRFQVARSYQAEDPQRAGELYREALNWLEQNSRQNHPVGVHLLDAVADLTEDPSEALIFLERALSCRKRAAGRCSPAVAGGHHHLAQFHFKMGNLGLALEHQQKALELAPDCEHAAVLQGGMAVLDPERAEDWLGKAQESHAKHGYGDVEVTQFLSDPKSPGWPLRAGTFFPEPQPLGLNDDEYDLVEVVVQDASQIQALLDAGETVCSLVLQYVEGPVPDLGPLRLRQLAWRTEAHQSVLPLQSCQMLRSLEVRGPQMASLPTWLLECRGLRYLDLAGCGLESADGLEALCELEHLDLAGNKLSQLPPLPRIRHLDLTRTPIERLPELPTCLQTLVVEECQSLFQLPASLGMAEGLEVLCCSGARLEALPGCGHWPRLRKLTLDHCPIQVLPNWLKESGELRLLSCNNTPLRSLPWSECPKLRYLAFSGTKFDQLPGGLVELRRLQAYCCELRALPEGPYPKLREALLFQNLLTSVPEGLFGFSLQRCELNDNQLEALPDSLSCADALQSLDVARNRLTQMPVLLDLPELYSLDFSHNRIESDPEGLLLRLPKLESLNLEGNRLETLEIHLDSDCPSLRRLNLNQNQLTSLAPEIVLFHALQSLSLYGNKLETLPDLLQLEQLESLQLGNNRLRRLPNLPNVNLLAQNNPLGQDVLLPAGSEQGLAEFLEAPQAMTNPFLQRFWRIHGASLQGKRQAILTRLLMEAGPSFLTHLGFAGPRLVPLCASPSPPALLARLGQHFGAERLLQVGSQFLTLAPSEEAWLWDCQGPNTETLPCLSPSPAPPAIPQSFAERGHPSKLGRSDAFEQSETPSGTYPAVSGWSVKAGAFIPSPGGGCGLHSAETHLEYLEQQVLYVGRDGRWYCWRTDSQNAPIVLDAAPIPRLLPGARAAYRDKAGLTIVDLATGQRRTLPLSVQDFCFVAPRFLAAFGPNGVSCCDLDSGQIHSAEFSGTPTCLLAIPGTQQFVIGTQEGTLQLWQCGDDEIQLVRIFASQPTQHITEMVIGGSDRSYTVAGESHDTPVRALAFWAGQLWSGSVYHHGSLKRWDLETGQCLETLPHKLYQVKALFGSSQGHLVALDESTVLARYLPGHTRNLGNLARAPRPCLVDAEGGKLLDLDEFGRISQWDLWNIERAPAELNLAQSPLEWDGAGRLLLTAGALLDGVGQTVLLHIGSRELTLSRDGTCLAVAGRGTVTIRRPIGDDWSVAESRTLTTGHQRRSYSGDRPVLKGDRVWVLHEEPEKTWLRAYRLADGTLAASIEGTENARYYESLSAHPSLPLALTRGYGCDCVLWDLEAQTVGMLRLPEGARYHTFHPNRPLLAVPGHGEVFVVDCRSGDVVSRFAVPALTGQAVNQLAFLGDDHLAFHSGTTELLLYRWTDGTSEVVFVADEPLLTLISSSNGRLAVSSRNRLWTFQYQ